MSYEVGGMDVVICDGSDAHCSSWSYHIKLIPFLFFDRGKKRD